MKSFSKHEVKKFLPQRPADAHKSSFGKVLALAGSDHYPGAAYLTTAGAYRVGAGLVTLASSLFVRGITASRISEVTYIDHTDVSRKINDYESFLVGPGCGQGEQTLKSLSIIFPLTLPKTVVDADGLNFLSMMPQWWKNYKFDGVLTPHLGEFSRLTNLSVNEVLKDRQKYVLEFAKKWGKVVVLKGARTIVASAVGEVYKDDFANAVLATAGTGDILAGMIAGFIAQGVNLFEAASLGVLIHSEAGELLEEEMGSAGVLSSDLLNKIPLVLKTI